MTENSNTDRGKTALTILGSGTCVPSLVRNPCSVLIEIDGAKLLFDSGAGTMKRLLETGTTIFDVSVIFYSHLHPDHTGELVSFIFSTKYPDQNSRKKPLTIVAGKGFLEFFNRLKKAYGTWIELEPDIFRIIELDNTANDRCDFNNFTVKSSPVDHNPESVAYRITDSRGKSIVYSGDTDFSENLISLSQNADILICESALPDELKVSGHLTPSQAGEIATRANVNRLVLTHFYPECDKVDIEKQCRKTYAGSLILAEDLMEIKL